MVVLTLARGNSVVAILAPRLENRLPGNTFSWKEKGVKDKGAQETQAASPGWGTEVGRHFCPSGVGLRFMTHDDGALFSLKALPHCLKVFPTVGGLIQVVAGCLWGILAL